MKPRAMLKYLTNFEFRAIGYSMTDTAKAVSLHGHAHFWEALVGNAPVVAAIARR